MAGHGADPAFAGGKHVKFAHRQAPVDHGDVIGGFGGIVGDGQLPRDGFALGEIEAVGGVVVHALCQQQAGIAHHGQGEGGGGGMAFLAAVRIVPGGVGAHAHIAPGNVLVHDPAEGAEEVQIIHAAGGDGVGEALFVPGGVVRGVIGNGADVNLRGQEAHVEGIAVHVHRPHVLHRDAGIPVLHPLIARGVLAAGGFVQNHRQGTFLGDFPAHGAGLAHLPHPGDLVGFGLFFPRFRVVAGGPDGHGHGAQQLLGFRIGGEAEAQRGGAPVILQGFAGIQALFRIAGQGGISVAKAQVGVDFQRHVSAVDHVKIGVYVVLRGKHAGACRAVVALIAAYKNVVVQEHRRQSGRFLRRLASLRVGEINGQRIGRRRGRGCLIRGGSGVVILVIVILLGEIIDGIAVLGVVGLHVHHEVRRIGFAGIQPGRGAVRRAGLEGAVLPQGHVNRAVAGVCHRIMNGQLCPRVPLAHARVRVGADHHGEVRPRPRIRGRGSVAAVFRVGEGNGQRVGVHDSAFLNVGIGVVIVIFADQVNLRIAVFNVIGIYADQSIVRVGFAGVQQGHGIA